MQRTRLSTSGRSSASPSTPVSLATDAPAAALAAPTRYDLPPPIIDLTDGPTHDSLTGLPNRSLLLDRLQQSMARMKRSGQLTAVFSIDFDEFQSSDRRTDLATGGELIRDFAWAARAKLRSSDTLARLDTREFIAVCEVWGSHDATTIAGRIGTGGDDTATQARTPLHRSIGIAIVSDPSEDPATVIGRADRAMARAKQSRVPNIVVLERDQEVIDMTTRIPLNGDNSGQRSPGVDAANASREHDANRASLVNSVRRLRLPSYASALHRSNHNDAVIDLTDSPRHVPFLVTMAYDPRIERLLRNGWGPLRPTVDLVSSSGPTSIGISGHVPSIAARDAARQLVGAAFRVKAGALPFSAHVGAAMMTPFLAELALEASAGELTANAVGIEIEAQAVRHLDFSDIEHLRALRQEGVAITIRRLDAASAHDSFLEAAAARVITVDLTGMSRERLTQLVTIASRANVAVIAEGVDTHADLATVTQAGCRYAQGELFAFGDTHAVSGINRR